MCPQYTVILSLRRLNRNHLHFAVLFDFIVPRQHTAIQRLQFAFGRALYLLSIGECRCLFLSVRGDVCVQIRPGAGPGIYCISYCLAYPLFLVTDNQGLCLHAHIIELLVPCLRIEQLILRFLPRHFPLGVIELLVPRKVSRWIGNNQGMGIIQNLFQMHPHIQRPIAHTVQKVPNHFYLPVDALYMLLLSQPQVRKHLVEIIIACTL